MKQLISLLLCTIVCVAAPYSAFAEDTFVITEDRFLEGTIEIDGTRFVLDAFFDDRVPEPMMNVKIIPSSITKKQLMAAVQNHFTIRKDFQDTCSERGHFTYYTPSWGSANVGDGDFSIHGYHEIVPTITDGVLDSATDQCKAFMNELGLAYYDIPAYATYCTFPKNGSWWTPITQVEAAGQPRCPFAIKLALEIEGMAMMLTEVGNRGSLDGIHMDNVLINSPYATFTFSADGELVSLWIHTYAVAEKQEMADPLITWQEALNFWYKEVAGFERWAYFFETTEVRVLRMQMVWLGNFRNILRPGWYIEIQCFDKETGKPFFAEDGQIVRTNIGVDAVNGEIW